ncbi:MAG: YHS domain-containing protein [Thermoproteota archaeon]|nr:MAG: YHS domain-containing protein [Candidatus Korarchaeota archaeon]RLG49759.1 MAG: YHS domain-containing protein [Candidatus Korarchaeota archaeon]
MVIYITTCPVYSMKVSGDTAWRENFEGKAYYFCSGHCKMGFSQNPKKYASGG